MESLELSFLYSHSSLQNALKEMGYSVSTIKKYLKTKQRQLEVKVGQTYHLPIDLLNQGKIGHFYEGPDIEILGQKGVFTFFEKPAGVHCHPLQYSDRLNCLSFFRSSDGGINLQVNEGDYSRGLLYRLDQGTSGVLVYVNDQNSWEFLRENFHSQVKQKVYFAVVKGKFGVAQKLEHFLAPSGDRGHQMRVVTNGGQAATALAELVEFNQSQNLSLVKIDLQSGLRHQIRVQLSYEGFPILGDELYGGPQAQRLFLHAHQYRFRYKEEDFLGESPLPVLFRDFFSRDGVL